MSKRELPTSKAEARAMGLKHYRGSVCLKHPELGGERRITGNCLGCYQEYMRSPERLAKQRERRHKDPERYREYGRKHRSKPEVQAKRREYQRSPEQRAKQRERRQSPAYKERQARYREERREELRKGKRDRYYRRMECEEYRSARLEKGRSPERRARSRERWANDTAYRALKKKRIREYRNTPEAREIRSKRRLERCGEDPNFKIRHYLRTRVRQSLSGRKKNARTFALLGYTPAQLRDHLEPHLVEGMSWENWGEWHIDHIRPCSSFDLTDDDQLRECWSLRNLRPLWGKENLAKGDTRDHELERRIGMDDASVRRRIKARRRRRR